jgi:hypothetical protein
MSFGKKTGLGPAMRVLRHCLERRRFSQLKFANGEHAMVLVAGMPAPSVEFVRLTLGGLLPWQTIWEFNPARAGGYGDYIDKLKAMFSPPSGESDDAVHYISEVLLPCRSIDEARTLLFDRERRANGAAVESGSPKFNPQSIGDYDDWRFESDPAPRRAEPKKAKATLTKIPNRYRIVESDGGKLLTCVEAPRVAMRAKRGLSIPSKQARKYPSGTIFLDGVAQDEPFIDFEEDLYNLDHPQECIQNLATCEQAMVLVRKGIDLCKRDWSVLANDSDLDTILAAWVLLNHLRINEDAGVRTKIMPLLRLEGVIDAHGPGAEYLSALPPELLRATEALRKQLQQQEFVLKDYGQWSEFDLLEYVADRLRAIDEIIYTPEQFAGIHEVNELARTDIGDGFLAVACASNAAMEDVERQLQKTYGERLGIFIFQNAPSTYKMHQVDRNLPATLDQAYERLNLLDPVATGSIENRWGGSAEIGFSPRKTQTGLTPTQIIAAVGEAFWVPKFFDVIAALPRALYLAGAALAPALVLIFIGNFLRTRGYIATDTVLLSSLALAFPVVILFCSKARLVPGLYGWRLPAHLGWISVMPAALIGAAIGGAWAPGSLADRTGIDLMQQFSGMTVLLFSLSTEVLFRGIVLGQLAARLPIQKHGGLWWHSWPTMTSAALYAVASLVLFVTMSSGQLPIYQSALIVTGSIIFGIASGIARERSESVLASVLLHWICAAALLCSRLLF